MNDIFLFIYCGLSFHLWEINWASGWFPLTHSSLMKGSCLLRLVRCFYPISLLLVLKWRSCLDSLRSSTYVSRNYWLKGRESALSEGLTLSLETCSASNKCDCIVHDMIAMLAILLHLYCEKENHGDNGIDYTVYSSIFTLKQFV